MFIFGKIFGAVFGTLIFGPLGLVIGLGVGHLFDKGLELNARISGTDVALSKKVFFKTTFNVMGYIAKIDGRVSEKEIQAAREVMAHLQLSPEQKISAMKYFNFGKSANFNFELTMDNFVKHCGFNPQLVQLFVEIQIQGALVDGLNFQKRQILERLCEKLRIPKSLLNQFAAHEYHQRSYNYQRAEMPTQRSMQDELTMAYGVLGVSEKATQTQVKKAYRVLMSQNHPDKLVAKGLPEEMIKIATEKTQRIQKAYELVCQSRGIK